jgi:septum site-determining protein MinD
MKIIAVNSYKRGTGKSFLAVNLAYTLAKKGLRIGLVDLSFLSPSLQYFLNTDQEPAIPISSFIADLSEYSLKISNLTPSYTCEGFGTLHLVSLEDFSASTKFVAPRFWKGLNNLGTMLKWDAVILDTSSGYEEKLLLLLALSDHVIITLRFDRQDYMGTLGLLELVRKLGNEEISLVITQTVKEEQDPVVVQEFEEVFKSPVDAVLPFSEDVLEMGSSGVYVERYPHSEINQQITRLAKKLL